MTAYELSDHALRDLDAILADREDFAGLESANELQQDLLAAFARLAVTPGLGHSRRDLTRLPYFFYTLKPYLIVYARQADPLPILAILHSSRNIRKLLKSRFL